MEYQACPSCRKGSFVFLGSFYRCTYCFHEEEARLVTHKLPSRPKEVQLPAKRPVEIQMQLFDTRDDIRFQ